MEIKTLKRVSFTNCLDPILVARSKYADKFDTRACVHRHACDERFVGIHDVSVRNM